MSQSLKERAKWSRRGFIGATVGAAAGFGIHAENTPGMQEPEPEPGKIKEYRILGRTGFKVSDIGFGAGDLSVPSVLEAAIDRGVNYIDTAEHYGRGNSERTIGEALKKWDRKSIFLTTKLNFGLGRSDLPGLRERFMKCLERLQTDYVDCLMIHMTPEASQLNHEPYHNLVKEMKALGKVRFTGLSNHGTEHSLAGPTKDDMEKVVLTAAEDGRFDVILFVYNFLQKEKGERILDACRKKNMGATLMKTNPVKFYDDIQASVERAKQAGRQIPETVLKMVEEYKERGIQAEQFMAKHGVRERGEIGDAAIRFCLDHPGVHSVCPSINNFGDVERYVGLSGKRLQGKDGKLLAGYGGLLGSFYCRHACGECEAACPKQVPVNSIMRFDHYFRAQRREKHAMTEYASLRGADASACFSCSGPCTAACPHGVPIQGLLVLAHQALSMP